MYSGGGMMQRLKGCLLIIVVSLILYMFGKSNEASRSNGLPTLAILPSLTVVAIQATEPPGVTIIPTVVVQRSGFVTITPAPGTVYPTATITDTSIPPTPAPTDTPAPQLTPMDLQILFTVSTVNLRSCPATSCSIIEKIPSGSGLGVDGMIDGEAVDPGNTVWYKVEHSAVGDEYAYSRFLSKNAPAQLQPNAQIIATNQVISPPVVVPTSAPSGTIICNDGYVWPGTTRQGACHGHGGIR